MKKIKIISAILAVAITFVGFGFGVDQAQASAADPKKTFIIGAIYDMPFGLSPDIAISDPIGRDKAIGETAKALASGRNIVIAGGQAGAVSNEMFESIVQEAEKITPNHVGSIIRIGGQDMEGTQRSMMYFLSSARYF